MNGIIVDTSSILFGLSNRNDVFSRIKEQLNLSPVISEGVVRELDLIAKSKKSGRKYARIAIALIDQHKIKTEKDSLYVDKWILKNAKKVGSVCTNDTKLKRELRSRGIATYSISRDGILR